MQERPAVKRGQRVNRVWGDEAKRSRSATGRRFGRLTGTLTDAGSYTRALAGPIAQLVRAVDS